MHELVYAVAYADNVILLLAGRKLCWIAIASFQPIIMSNLTNLKVNLLIFPVLEMYLYSVCDI